MKNLVSTARQALQARRADRQQWSRLERDLSMYSSPADRLEIESTFDRYPDQDTALLRRTLALQTSQSV